ncbi:MAG: NusG domain II-containing protein [Lachnospiraceae bacterium]|nr:NusG domain II-containing protein [Lachnospiraceae bacterium]
MMKRKLQMKERQREALQMEEQQQEALQMKERQQEKSWMEQRQGGKRRRADVLLLTSFVLVGIGLLCGIFYQATPPKAVEVRVDGAVRARYPLDVSCDVVIDGVGGTNRLRIEGGAAWIEEASCPDKLCVHMGRISRVGQSVICLPHQVVVEIVGESDGDAPVDAYSG